MGATQRRLLRLGPLTLPYYTEDQLYLPAGTQDSPLPGAISYPAAQGGWRPTKHSDWWALEDHPTDPEKRMWFPKIYTWYDQFLGNSGDPRNLSAIPLGEER
jgi:hypothetical protein